MLPHVSSACPDQGISSAQRLAAIANSAAAQAVVDQAPPFTRQQLDIARAACASATARHQATARAAMLAGIGRHWEAAASLPRIPGNDPLVTLGVLAS